MTLKFSGREQNAVCEQHLNKLQILELGPSRNLKMPCLFCTVLTPDPVNFGCLVHAFVWDIGSDELQHHLDALKAHGQGKGPFSPSQDFDFNSNLILC